MIDTATKRRPTPRENATPDGPDSMRKRVLLGVAHAREPRFGNAACGGLDNVEAAELRWDKSAAGPLCVACLRISSAGARRSAIGQGDH